MPSTGLLSKIRSYVKSDEIDRSNFVMKIAKSNGEIYNNDEGNGNIYAYDYIFRALI